MLELYGVLTLLGSQETPLRLTITRNLKAVEPLFNDFQEKKQAKFESVVKVTENGLHVLKPEAEELVKEGKLNANALPYGAFEFDSEEGLKELNLYLKELQEEEVDFNPIAVSMDKRILIQKDENESFFITLEEYLDSGLSKIDPKSLATLLDSGVIS